MPEGEVLAIPGGHMTAQHVRFSRESRVEPKPRRREFGMVRLLVLAKNDAAHLAPRQWYSLHGCGKDDLLVVASFERSKNLVAGCHPDLVARSDGRRTRESWHGTSQADR